MIQREDLASFWLSSAMAAAVFGVAAIIALASLPGIADARFLLWLGRMTMPIFVLHVMFIAGTRIILMRLEIVTAPALILIICVAAGLVGPLIVERFTRSLKLNRWLGFQ